MDEQAISTFYHIGIDLDFENIYSFCKFTETAFKQGKDKFYSLYKTKLNELKAEEKEKFEQLAIEIHWKLYSIFPELQWNSIFNSAYAMFEKHLNYVCKILEKETKTEIGLKDLKGQGIERAKIFLSKVVGINKVFDSPEWNEIQNYSKVRNILVHTSGKLDLTQKKHKDVFDYAKNHSKLFVYPENPDSDWAKINILPEFIHEALISYRILLGRICKSNIQKNKG